MKNKIPNSTFVTLTLNVQSFGIYKFYKYQMTDNENIGKIGYN